LWRVAGDPRSLLPGTAAGIMQLMLPGLGAGVTDHSDFFADPFDRIFRSIPPIWRSIFSDDVEGAATGTMIRRFHDHVKGTDEQGRRYHALDPDVFWWAHATFTWEFFRARQAYLPGRFGRTEREQLYAETVTWYRRYGVSDRPVPPTYDAFQDRFEEICRTQLELTPAVRWVLDPEANPGARGERIRLPGPLSALDGIATHLGAELLRVLVYGAMPDTVRRRFELPWSHADRVAYVHVCGLLQAAGPLVRRGGLDDLWPEGTPHLDPRDGRTVVVAGPSRRQRATSSPAEGTTTADADPSTGGARDRAS
jgi:uncharacterized protein (DUF2236 family)